MSSQKKKKQSNVTPAGLSEEQSTFDERLGLLPKDLLKYHFDIQDIDKTPEDDRKIKILTSKSAKLPAYANANISETQNQQNSKSQENQTLEIIPEYLKHHDAEQLDFMEPHIESEDLDKGDIKILGDRFRKFNIQMLAVGEKTRSIDIFVNDQNDQSLVCTYIRENKQDKNLVDTFIIINKFDIQDCLFETSRNHEIMLTFDGVVGPKSHYKTNKCWKQFRDHIYYYKMENLTQEQLWKINPQTGKQFMVNEQINNYKTFDIQFSDCNKYENNKTGMTKIHYEDLSEDQWLSSQFIAKIIGNKDDNQLKIVTHNLDRSIAEEEVYSYKDNSKVYKSIQPPWSVALKQSGESNEYLTFKSSENVIETFKCNGKSFERQGTGNRACNEQLKIYLQTISVNQKIIIWKKEESRGIQKHFNMVERHQDTDLVLNQNKEITVYVESKEADEAMVFFTNSQDNNIYCQRAAVNANFRSITQNTIHLKKLVHFDWPIYQIQPYFNTVFLYKDYDEKIDNQEFIKAYNVINDNWQSREVDKLEDAFLLDRAVTQEMNYILPWYIDYQMYKSNIPFLIVNDYEITLNFMNKSSQVQLINKIDIIPAQFFGETTKSRLLLSGDNGLRNMVQICQSSNLRLNDTQDIVVVFRVGRDEFRIQYRDQMQSASASLIGSKVYMSRDTMDQIWKVLPLFETDDSMIVKGVIVWQDIRENTGFEQTLDDNRIKISKQDFDIPENEPVSSGADFTQGHKTIWYNQRIQRPFKISFDYRFDVAGELYPVFANSKDDVLEGNKLQKYGITWSVGTNRNDISFRTKIFDSIPKIQRNKGYNMKIGKWYTIESIIDKKTSEYYINRQFYAKAFNMQDGDVPVTGFFGLIHKFGRQQRSIRNMTLTRLERKSKSNWKIFSTFENFTKKDYQIRTEIGGVGYKLQDQNWSPFSTPEQFSLLLEARLNLHFHSEIQVNEQKELLNRLIQTLSNMIPRSNFNYATKQLEETIQDKQTDMLQPLEIFFGKSIASFMDSEQLKKKIKGVYEKNRKFKSLIQQFIGNHQGLLIFAKKYALGQRMHNEVSDDFQLQTVFEERLIKDDLQSFKIIFQILQKQENVSAAYKVLMRNIHLIIYEKQNFAHIIKDFFKDSKETSLTFGMRIESDLLPEYSFDTYIRSLDQKTQTQNHIKFSDLREDETFLQLTEEGIENYLKIMEQIIKDDKTISQKQKQSEILVEHFRLDFGNVRIQNMILDAKNQWTTKKQKKMVNRFAQMNDVQYSQLLAMINYLYGDDIEQQTVLRSIMNFQFIQTFWFYTIQAVFHIFVYVIPIIYYIFNQNELNKDLNKSSKLLIYCIIQVSQITFYIPELIEMNNNGLIKYFKNLWNVFDFLRFINFNVFFLCEFKIIRIESTYFGVMLIIFMFIKTNFLLRVSQEFGLLVALIKAVLIDMIPFTTYLFMWYITFVLLYKLLGTEATGNSQLGDNDFTTYLLMVYHNGVGAIVNRPVYDKKYNKNTYFIYIVWFFNHFVCYIVLLNFLISVIQSTYSDLMNKANVFKFNGIADLNREAYQVLKFFPQTIRMASQSIILTLPIQDEDQTKAEDELATLIKIMRHYMKSNVSSEISNLRSQISDVTNQMRIKPDINDIRRVVEEAAKNNK